MTYLTVKNKRWLAIGVSLLSAALLIGFNNLQNYKLLGISLSVIAAILLAYNAIMIFKREI